jgi:hypothetical protein
MFTFIWRDIVKIVVPADQLFRVSQMLSIEDSDEIESRISSKICLLSGSFLRIQMSVRHLWV